MFHLSWQEQMTYFKDDQNQVQLVLQIVFFFKFDAGVLVRRHLGSGVLRYGL